MHSDFRAQEEEIYHCFHLLPFYFPWSDRARCNELSVLSQLFHSPPSHSSRGSLVSLCFLPLVWYHLHIWGCWYFFRQAWLQLVTHPAWHFTWCTLHISKISRWKYTALLYSIPSFEQSHLQCKVLSVVSWPMYRFLRRQVRWSGVPITNSFPQFVFVMIHTSKALA